MNNHFKNGIGHKSLADYFKDYGEIMLFVTAIANLLDFFSKPGHEVNLQVLLAIIGSSTFAIGWFLQWFSRNRK